MRGGIPSFVLMAVCLLPLSMLGEPVQTAGAEAGQRQVSFSFERKGLAVPEYKLVLRADGTGQYSGQEVISSNWPRSRTEAIPQAFDRGLRVSSATLIRAFELVAHLNNLNTTCASRARNVADTGTKVLAYAGPDGSGTCTYNYSDVKDVVTLTEMFEGIAETMDRGRQMERLHRFDRLGLDDATSFLVQAVREGRALELENIETTLRSIADDPDVIERVRTKANLLLRLIPSEIAQQ